MRTITYVITALVLLLCGACNKEKKLMKNLQGDWRIDVSEKTIYRAGGSEETVERIYDAGKLMISAGSSDESKKYDLFFVDSVNDTLKSSGDLVTDEYNDRIIMVNALVDSTCSRNIVWTIEKEKRNKQVWSVYGVDSTLFYPVNNKNPGNAVNWISWKITLKREKK